MGIKYIGSDLRFEVTDLANATSEIISTSTEVGSYKVFDKSFPNTCANFSWDGTSLNVSWIQGSLVSDQDEALRMCIYIDSGNVILKNNLGSTKTFVVYKQI